MSAADFALQLDRAFAEKVEGHVVAITQKLSMEALSRVVLKSPVDTGRFRGNWTVGIGTRPSGSSETMDAGGHSTIGAGSSVITGMTEPEIVYIANNLPYAERLENGWSNQAPGGIVAVTVAEIQSFFGSLQ